MTQSAAADSLLGGNDEFLGDNFNRASNSTMRRSCFTM